MKLGEFKIDPKGFALKKEEILKASENNHNCWKTLQLMCLQLERIFN